MPRPRIVRRQPLAERIWAAINPLDFLLWLSEEIETRELDSEAVGTQLGLAANFLFLLGRANLGPSSSADDDVFGDGPSRGWLSYLVQLLVWAGFCLSITNAVCLFSRKRHYRLFEANIERAPGTPSAERVRVQSSPASSASPLRLLNSLVGVGTAESRAYPDGTRDVWELAVWDPRPASLALLAFFSPLHVLLYMFELPLDPLEPRPSVAVLKCIVLQFSLSAVMKLMQSKNDQRQKDNAIIQKEVFHEYDAKFVQPRLHPVVRDVGVQASMGSGDDDGDNHNNNGSAGHELQDSVEPGVPTTLIRRSFQTHPNANYLRHVDPDYAAGPSAFARLQQKQPSSVLSPRLLTPANRQTRAPDSFTSGYYSTSGTASSRPLPTSGTAPALGHTGTSAVASPSFGLSGGDSSTPLTSARQHDHHMLRASTGTNTNFGGSLGVFSHVNSPLKKATSLNDLGQISGASATGFSSPRSSRDLAEIEQREAAERMRAYQRRGSPLKEETGIWSPEPAAAAADGPPDSQQSFRYRHDQSSPPVPFNPLRSRVGGYKYERFPSRC